MRNCCPPITPYFVMKVGRVPHIPYHRPGDAAAAALVAQTIGRYAAQGSPVRAVMLARLGPNVWHDTPGRRHGRAGRAGRNRPPVDAVPAPPHAR